MKTTAEAIIFAINAAIRLGRNTQQAYAKSLKSRAIVLPLPTIVASGNKTTLAKQFFSDPDEASGGAQFLEEIEELNDLHRRLIDLTTPKPLTDLELKRYTEYYEQLAGTLAAGVEGELPPEFINVDELAALLRIRQWERGREPGASPLQTVAGTLVEIGIDYFNQVPGALNHQSSLGRVMTHFLAAIDDIPFADPDGMRRFAPRIVPQLFIAAAESVATLSEELRADPKIQEFVRAASRGIATDLFARLSTATAQREEATLMWGRILLRSAVANAAGYVFQGPQRLFDLNDGATQLIQRTGGVLLETILDDPDSLNLANGFTSESLDRLFATTFTVVAQHPRLIDGRDGFREIVVGLSGAMAQTPFSRPDFLPELVRLVLLHLATNLPELWRDRGPGVENLALEAARQTLFALSEPTPDGWRPDLNKDELLTILATLLETTAANPQWVTTEIDGLPLLRRVIRIVLRRLAAAPRELRLSTPVLLTTLRAVLTAVSQDPGLLQRVRWTNDPEESLVLETALQLLLDATLDRAATDPIDRRADLEFIIDYGLRAVLTPRLGPQGILILQLLCEARLLPTAKTAGTRPALADPEAIIDLALVIIAQHPELLTHNRALAVIIAQIAERLDADSFSDPYWLPQLLRISLRITAQRSDLLLLSDRSEPRYLAAIALTDALNALAGDNDNGPWRPQLGAERILTSVEAILTRVIDHPDWLLQLGEDDSLWRSVWQATLDSLAKLPAGARIGQPALELIVWNGMRAVAANPDLLQNIHWADDDTEAKLLQRFIDLVVALAYPSEASGPERSVIFDDLLRYVFSVLLVSHPDRRGLRLLELILAGFEYQHDRPFDPEQANRLLEVGLDILVAHPELVTRHAIWQKMIHEVAATLDSADVPVEHLLPEILRLTLRVGAGHLDRLVGWRQDSPRSVLALATEQILRAFTRPPGRGKPWRPRYTETDLLQTLELVLQSVVAHPEWVNNKFLEMTLGAILDGVQAAAVDRPFPLSTVLMLVRAGLQTVRLRRRWAIDYVDEQGQQKRLLLEYAVEGLVVSTHGPAAGDQARWTLGQTEIFEAIALAWFARLTRGPADEGLVIQLRAAVAESVADLEQNLAWTVEELLQQLEAV